MSQRRTRYLLMCLYLLPLADAPFLGQTQGQFSLDFPFQIHKRVEEVRILFNVADKHGRPVVNLRPEDVVVLEDGQPVSTFTEFSRPTGLPLLLTMLVDASASMAGNFTAERAAAQRILSAGSDPDTDAAAWASFSAEQPRAEMQKSSDWRNSPAAATPRFQSGPLSGLRPTGATAILDALNFAMQRPRFRLREQPGRRVILLLSDGEDNTSRHTLAEILVTAQREEVAIYAVAVHHPRLEFPGDRVLRSLCEGTGGRFFLFPDYAKADSALTQIQSDVRSEYAVSFHPRVNSEVSIESGHSLAIEIRNHRNLRVQARKAYFLGQDSP